MITIHKASKQEVPEIKKLLHKTWMATYSNIYPPEAIDIVTSEWHALEVLAQQVENPETLFVVAKEDETIVAIANATRAKSLIHIQRLYVSPQHQRTGIGSQLMRAITDGFGAASTLRLEVEKQNTQAQEFYAKHGFKTVGNKTFKIKNIQFDCLVMEKIIRPL